MFTAPRSGRGAGSNPVSPVAGAGGDVDARDAAHTPSTTAIPPNTTHGSRGARCAAALRHKMHLPSGASARWCRAQRILPIVQGLLERRHHGPAMAPFLLHLIFPPWLRSASWRRGVG